MPARFKTNIYLLFCNLCHISLLLYYQTSHKLTYCCRLSSGQYWQLFTHLIGVWGGIIVASSSGKFFFGVLSTCDLNIRRLFNTSVLILVNIRTLKREKEKALHLYFRHLESLIAIKKQSSIQVFAFEVVLFVLLVEVRHLWRKCKVQVT